MTLMAEVFGGGELFVEAGGLEDDADLLADGFALGFQIEAEEGNFSIADGDEGGEDSEEGGFTAAVGPEESEDFTGLDGEVQIIDGDSVAVGVGEVFDLEDGFRHSQFIYTLGCNDETRVDRHSV